MTIKELGKLGKQRDELIALLNLRFEKSVSVAQRAMLKSFMEGFVDMLQRDENGNIASNTYNQNMLGTIDNLYAKFAKKHNVFIINELMKSVDGVLNFNNKYFSTLAEKSRLTPIKAQAVNNIKAWLGIDGDKTKTNGYLDTLINNPTVKNQIKDFSVRAVYGRKGWMALKKETEEFIDGKNTKDGKTLGAFQKYYRNYTYDLISQVDRATAQTYANDLKFEFAIYEGGIIKDSRPFCREHNGNVYHISEILKFNPPTAKPPNYDPLTDMGGYGCRHHYNWIPTALALAMRPDAKKFLKDNENATAVKDEKKFDNPVDKKVAKEKEPTISKMVDPSTKFADIKPLKIDAFKPSDEFLKDVDKIGKASEQLATLKKQAVDEMVLYNTTVAKLNALLREGKANTTQYKEMKATNDKLGNSRQGTIKKITSKQREIEKDGEIYFNNLLAEKTSISSVVSKGTISVKQKEAFDIFKKLSAGYNEGTEINFVKIPGRAHYDPVKNTVNLSSSSDKYTIIHELAHSLERNNHVMKAAVDFLERRTEGKPIKKFKDENPNYRDDEVYKDGGFYDKYVGKLYKSKVSGKYRDYYATEVISMGIENMMRNPRLFYKQDKEHFNLIFNLFFK